MTPGAEAADCGIAVSGDGRGARGGGHRADEPGLSVIIGQRSGEPADLPAHEQLRDVPHRETLRCFCHDAAILIFNFIR